MAISQHYLTLFCLCLSTVLSYTIKSKPDVSKDANVSVTHEATRSLHARQMAFVRDCQPNQEQAILAATRRLSTVLLEGILASEQQTLETDEEMRSIFNNQWMQSRPNPDDNQVSVHFVLQRVWDEAYFTFLQAEEHRPVTAPGARIAPGGPGVRITCEDVQHRCRGMRPLYITHDRGIDREIYAGGNTIVICEPFYSIPTFDVGNLMERDQLWFLFEAFALNRVTIPEPMGTLAPNYYGRRLAYPYYMYAKTVYRVYLRRGRTEGARIL